MCMFSGICTVKSLPRVSLKNGKISLCNEEFYVGYVEEGLENAYKNISKFKKEREEQCKGCNYNHCCSKCLSLDEDKKYLFCNFIKKHSGVYIYINIIVFILKNITNLNSNSKINIYCKLNYDLTNRYIEIPESICYICCEPFLIIYNTHTHRAYVCDKEEKNLVEKIIINKENEYCSEKIMKFMDKLSNVIGFIIK